ncbi:MAG: VIT1/CCC1 transporter family protein [Candidatus Saccharimonadales bacterium]
MSTTKQTTSEVLAARAAQVQRGGARAAVLGVNDGLVSTLCIVVGVAATGADNHTVLVAGLAGLLAGAISMAAGEWISVKAQVELFEGVLADLKHAVKKDRTALVDNLAKNFEEHGIDTKTAAHAAADVAKTNKQFMSMYSAQIIGVNEDELGSPWVAAVSSFLLFTAGALVPLVPWFMNIHGVTGIVIASALTGFAGLFVGGYTARTSGRPVVYGAFRQFAIILFSAIVTYGIGHLFGVAIA